MNRETPDELKARIDAALKEQDRHIDPILISAYLTEYERYHKSQTNVDELGLMVRLPNTDKSIENPYLKTTRESVQALHALGLTSGITRLISPVSAKVGRPSKYDPKMCDKVIDCMSKGMMIEEVCSEIGIDKSTFHEWKKQFPEFSDAYKRGKDASAAWWQKLGREGSSGESDINPATWIFNMKNRFGWADRNMLMASIDTEPEEAEIIRKGFYDRLAERRATEDADTS